MEELMLINPRGRKRRRSTAGRARDSKGRFLPLRARRSNPANPAPRRRRRRNPVGLNPQKRTRRVYAAPVRRRRRNPVEGLALLNPRRRYRRSNPAGLLGDTVMPAAMGAAGALGLDVLMGFLPIPAALRTGPARYLVKGAGAIGLGIVAGYVVRPATAHQMAVGALTVVIHEALKSTVRSMVPTLQLGMAEDFSCLEYVSPAMLTEQGVSAYLEPPEMGAYLEPSGLEELAYRY